MAGLGEIGVCPELKKLFTYVASQGINSVLDFALQNVGAGLGIAHAGIGGALFFGLDGAAVFNPISPNLGAFLGSYLGHQLVQAHTTAGAIGGQIGSSLGTIIGGSSAVAGSAIVGSISAGLIQAGIAASVVQARANVVVVSIPRAANDNTPVHVERAA